MDPTQLVRRAGHGGGDPTTARIVEATSHFAPTRSRMTAR
jgi:hypothetical protein